MRADAVCVFWTKVSRNLLCKCLRAKPAAYSATAGTPQAWLGMVGRGLSLEQKPPMQMRRGGTWLSTSWLPGYIRGSPRSKVATSIGALTSPPAPSDSFACIFCVAYTNFLCVCSLDNHKRLGMPHLYDIIIDNFLFYHMPNFSTTIFLSPNHFFIS